MVKSISFRVKLHSSLFRWGLGLGLWYSIGDIILKVDQVYCEGSCKCSKNDKLPWELWSFGHLASKATHALSITSLMSGCHLSCNLL
jgi:hypothetical protein